MPVRRTPDGRIIEERTKNPPFQNATDEDRTRTVAGDAAPASPGGYDDPTVVRFDKKETPPPEPTKPADDEERTVVHGIKGSGDTPAGATTDAVAGWLVVVEGPGTGQDSRIGVGRNTVGRDPANRIPLPFGDTRISRQAHFFINYDNLNRVFSVNPGNGPNLAYLNGTPIEERHTLAAGDTIRVGRTTLQFVPFCGDGFNWADED